MKAIVQLSVYSGALVSLMLPFYDFECHCFFRPAEPRPGTKYKTAEARQYIHSMNRAQQGYFVENEEFTTNLQQLGIGIRSETESYSYRILEPMVPVQSSGYPILQPPRDRIFMVAQSKDPLNEPSYLGAVFVLPDDKVSSITQMCQTKIGHSYPSQLPKMVDDQIICPPKTSEVDR